MPDYRRNRVPGGTHFFTVNLLERGSTLLVNRVDAHAMPSGKCAPLVPFTSMRGSCCPSTCMSSGRCRPKTPTTRFAGRPSRSPLPRPCRRPNGFLRSAWPGVSAEYGNSVATAILGTRDPRRAGLRGTCGLRPHQSAETWPGGLHGGFGRTPRFSVGSHRARIPRIGRGRALPNLSLANGVLECPVFIRRKALRFSALRVLLLWILN